MDKYIWYSLLVTTET